MGVNLGITIAEKVHSDIEKAIVKYNRKNKSEFVEELIRLGLKEWEKEQEYGDE